MANGITFHALHSLVCIDGFLNDVILLVHLLSFSSNFWAPLDSISTTYISLSTPNSYRQYRLKERTMIISNQMRLRYIITSLT